MVEGEGVPCKPGRLLEVGREGGVVRRHGDLCLLLSSTRLRETPGWRDGGGLRREPDGDKRVGRFPSLGKSSGTAGPDPEHARASTWKNNRDIMCTNAVCFTPYESPAKMRALFCGGKKESAGRVRRAENGCFVFSSRPPGEVGSFFLFWVPLLWWGQVL
jgi:hypothetical protein